MANCTHLLDGLVVVLGVHAVGGAPLPGSLKLLCTWYKGDASQLAVGGSCKLEDGEQAPLHHALHLSSTYAGQHTGVDVDRKDAGGARPLSRLDDLAAGGSMGAGRCTRLQALAATLACGDIVAAAAPTDSAALKPQPFSRDTLHTHRKAHGAHAKHCHAGARLHLRSVVHRAPAGGHACKRTEGAISLKLLQGKLAGFVLHAATRWK